MCLNRESSCLPARQAVADACGWSELGLRHGFHATKPSERCTMSEPARRTVLDRLVALNRQRSAEEVKAGLHVKGARKDKRVKSCGLAPIRGKLAPRAQGDFFG